MEEPQTESARSLVKQTIRGIAWASAAKLFAQALGLLVTLVLVRVLSREDFGLIAMVAAFTGFVELFGELGFGAALVQRADLQEKHISSVFWMNLATGVVLAGIVALLAPVIASFYEEPILRDMTVILAVTFLLAPLNMVQLALLSRSMRFGTIAIVESVSLVCSSSVAIALALSGYGVWSLVFRPIAGQLASIVGFWLASGWRPRAMFDSRAVRELLRFSLNLLGFSTINYWARKFDDLLVGRVMGAERLGVYDRAYATMMMPLTEISSVIGRVMFPAMSRLKEPAEIKAMYLRTVSMIALISFPLMALLFVAADAFVLTIYGPQWVPIVPVLRILCILEPAQCSRLRCAVVNALWIRRAGIQQRWWRIRHGLRSVAQHLSTGRWEPPRL